MSNRGYGTYYAPKGGSNQGGYSKGGNSQGGYSRGGGGGYADDYGYSQEDYDQGGYSKGGYSKGGYSKGGGDKGGYTDDYGYSQEDYGYSQDDYSKGSKQKYGKPKSNKYGQGSDYQDYAPKEQKQSTQSRSDYPEYVPKEQKQSTQSCSDYPEYAPKEQKQSTQSGSNKYDKGSYAPKESKQSSQGSNYNKYAPKEEFKQGPVKIDTAFPTLGSQEPFPTLGGDPSFPSLGSAPAVDPDSQWGHNIIKKKVQTQSTPFVPEPTAPSGNKVNKPSAKTTENWPTITPSTKNPEPVQKATPSGGVTSQQAPGSISSTEGEDKAQGSKNKKGKKGKIQQEEKAASESQQKDFDNKPKVVSLFNQVKENLSTRSNTSLGRDDESKTTQEYEDAGEMYHEYEKYMREPNEDDYYDYANDYNDDDYHEDEVGYEEAEAELDSYLNQHSTGRGGGGLVLMVAEKPSIAKSITEALSGGKSKMRKGRSKFCPVHEFSGSIFGKPAYFRVTSVAGHVFTTDFPQKYQDWQKIDPVKLFEINTIKKEANPSSRIVQHLQSEAKKASYLVLWLDNDKEGENICFEVLDIVKDFMKKENFQQVYRARFSSIVKQDIQQAFRAINSGPNYNESISVDARQIIDLKIGVAFSRFQTMYFTQRYPQLNTKLVSYGPCQTPTLGFCVKRDDEIHNFKPKTFYRVVPTIALPNGGIAEIQWSGEKTFSQQEAHKIKSDIDKNKELTVTHAQSKEGTKGRPEALNTVQMLRVASAQLGIGPQQAMHIAERLYLSGYLTYPRTESTSYPTKYDFRGLVQALGSVSTFSDYSRKLLQGEMRNPHKGKDAGDHPPITPTNKTPSRDTLRGDEWRLYEYIARHFLATISQDARMTKRSITFTTGQHEFTLKGSTTISLGFTEIMPWIKLDDNLVPEFKINQTCLISIIEVRTGQTTAPDHLTESELISLMEKHGIGTDASMATHINNICERNYVKVVGNNRKLVPTDLGSSLVHGYELIDHELVAPTLRSNIEKSVEMIAKGQANYDAVLKEIIAIFTRKYSFFKDNINKMDAIFGGSFGTVEENIAQGRPFSKCGKCNRLLKYADKFNKLHCEQCKITLDLPTGGVFKLAGDRKCPLDNYGLVIFSVLNHPARYYICPHCYNNSPFPDISTTLTCNLCVQEDCPYSVVQNEIKDCDICKEGQFIIDQQAGAKATATCNNCSAEITIADNVTSVVRDKKECDSCGAYLFKTIALKGQTEGFTQQEYKGICIFCHKDFVALTKTKLPPNPTRRGGSRGGRRGRGRGRGRRGGRGRGRGKPERDWRDI